MIFGQITQQVFVAEEWYCDTHKRSDAEALSRAETEKTLGAIKQDQYEMVKKLKEAQSSRLSAEAGLKTAKKQAENQRQKLHVTEINLATERQSVLDLKAALQKAKEGAQLAKEVAEAEKRAAYQLGMEEMQVRLTEELLEVCRDYYSVTWDRALSVASVPADFVCRLPRSVFYPPEIREVPVPISSPPADTPESSEQPLAILDAIPLTETTKGSSQAGDQGQGVGGEKGKGKKLSAKSKDTVEEKTAETENQGADPQAKDVPSSQPGQNEDPPASPAEA